MTRITRDENGTYHWVGTVDVGYEQKTFKIAGGVCGGICALFIIMGLIMGGDMLGVVLLCSLGVAAIVGGVCWLFNRSAGNRTQRYRMTEDAIVFDMGRRTVSPFTFRSIRKAVVYTSRNMIELYQAMGSGPVFVPHEDFGFVRDYIIRRLPENTEVVYE